MNKNKATHKGQCQACGAMQKLPGGTLSTHGYTVKWGFFSGVCHGAGHLPFEQSKDLIESCILRANEQIAATKETQKNLRAKNDGKAWVQRSVYGGSIWEEAEIVQGSNGFQFAAVFKDGIKQAQHSYACEYPKSIAEATKFANERRAKSFDQTLSQLAQYIRWQTERIQGWKPTALTPL